MRRFITARQHFAVIRSVMTANASTGKQAIQISFPVIKFLSQNNNK
jgi:hypothetical protein